MHGRCGSAGKIRKHFEILPWYLQSNTDDGWNIFPTMHEAAIVSPIWVIVRTLSEFADGIGSQQIKLDVQLLYVVSDHRNFRVFFDQAEEVGNERIPVHVDGSLDGPEEPC